MWYEELFFLCRTLSKGDITLRKKQREKNNPVIQMDDARKTFQARKRKNDVHIIPKNTVQETYVDNLTDPTFKINLAIGPAGTGKTLLAVLRAIQMYKDGEVDRIVITRPAVSVDEQHGFLPGDLNAKMDPWVRPIMDVFEEYYTPVEIAAMLEDRVIEIAPLAYMRGRTFKNAYIVADEIQNATPEQVKMLLTRIGHDAFIAVTGDLLQHDRGFEKNGLKDFIEKTGGKMPNGIAMVTFEKKHVERHPIVATVLDVYGED